MSLNRAKLIIQFEGAAMPKDREASKESRQKAWQLVNDGEGKRVERMRVPGGWLYAVTTVEADAKGQVSLAFIPLQDRKKDTASPANDEDGEIGPTKPEVIAVDP